MLGYNLYLFDSFLLSPFYLVLFTYLYIDIYNKRQPACLDYRL